MTDSVVAALGVVVASLISGAIGLWNRRRTDKNADQIQSLKSAVERDRERLRAKLAHGQAVSATQWSAEFAAYQAIWKGIVDVRPIADKLVNRERELHQIGLPKEYLNNELRLRHRQDLTHQLVIAAEGLLSAIHDNAPFYPASIRNAANEAHKTTIRVVGKNLSAITEAMKGNNVVQTEEFHSENVAVLLQLVKETDKVEALIRERLEAVQVINPLVA